MSRHIPDWHIPDRRLLFRKICRNFSNVKRIGRKGSRYSLSYRHFDIRALTLRSLRENRGRLFWRAEFWSRTLFSISGSFGFNVNEDIWWENESFDWPNVKESFDWLVFRQPELPTLSAPASPTQALKFIRAVLPHIKWGASSRWSSSLYYPCGILTKWPPGIRTPLYFRGLTVSAFSSTFVWIIWFSFESISRFFLSFWPDRNHAVSAFNS